MSVLTSLLVDLKQHASEALDAIGQPAGHSVIVNGDIAWDLYDDGYLYVRLANAEPLGGTHRCAIPLLVYTIYVGVLRCATAFGPDGQSPPTTEVLTEEALGVVADQEAIQEAITCNFNWTPYGNNKNVVGWTPLGPQGGMAGGEWQIDVRIIPNCGC